MYHVCKAQDEEKWLKTKHEYTDRQQFFMTDSTGDCSKQQGNMKEVASTTALEKSPPYLIILKLNRLWPLHFD